MEKNIKKEKKAGVNPCFVMDTLSLLVSPKKINGNKKSSDVIKPKSKVDVKKEPKIVWHTIKDANDKIVAEYTIQDKIEFAQCNKKNKILSFQMLHFKGKQPTENRFAYYNIDGTRKSFGRFVCNIPQNDLVKLIEEAHKRGWF